MHHEKESVSAKLTVRDVNVLFQESTVSFWEKKGG